MHYADALWICITAFLKLVNASQSPSHQSGSEQLLYHGRFQPAQV